MTDPSKDAPRQCCFTFPLGDSGVVAAICLTPTSNVTAELKNNPITKVGTYWGWTLPCEQVT